MHVALFVFLLLHYLIIHSFTQQLHIAECMIMKTLVSLKPLLFVKWRKTISSPNLTFDSELREVIRGDVSSQT